MIGEYMNGIKEYFDKIASDWSEFWLSEREKSGVVKTFYDLYASAGNINPRILDVGSGLGYDSYLLSKYGAEVVGVVFSEKSLDIAKQNAPNCNFIVKDITESIDDLGEFDGVFCTAVLDYIDIMKINKTIDNFAKIMKKGALLFISVLDGNGKNEQKSYSFIDGEEYILDFFNYNAEQLCTFALPDLKLVDTFTFDDFEDGWKYYVFMKK